MYVGSAVWSVIRKTERTVAVMNHSQSVIIEHQRGNLGGVDFNSINTSRLASWQTFRSYHCTSVFILDLTGLPYRVTADRKRASTRPKSHLSGSKQQAADKNE